MEAQAKFEDLQIGKLESVKLKPAKVKIVKVRIEPVGEQKKAMKVVCECKHPDQEESIAISAVKRENKGKLEVSGLWVNLDKEGNIQKGSALANFMTFLASVNPRSLEGKEIETAEDDKGYLVFKAY